MCLQRYDLTKESLMDNCWWTPLMITLLQIQVESNESSIYYKILNSSCVTWTKSGWLSNSKMKLDKSWLKPTYRTTRCITPVVIVLCTKLDAECDRQATVVGRLLTALGDTRRAIVKLFLVQRLAKSSRWNYAYVWRYSNFLFVW